ncbi:hypothetical protein PLEOSDRAFT_1034076 [Pleurotus ostreatus PC15]|uniref:Purine nucleoside phosphorylase n=1 Tax=Pleurotus ostreatus (strain PC15) TaxID=1137138 RepID=A0A067P0G4_PLEO1|nr:hypothetical protein PLEOSDRAFT_1034076 [Pleurotus ostreatus PC15]
MAPAPTFETIASTVEAIRSQLPDGLKNPRVGIVCGSGLSGLATSMKEVVEVAYDNVPGFAKSTVPGHRSSLAFGFMGDNQKVPVVAMLGRFHPYEGHSLSTVVYPIRVLAALGIKDIIITNAAGALNPEIKVGTVVVVRDHLALPGLAGMNPLLGPTFSSTTPRFLPVSDAYSPALRRLVFLAANELSIPWSDFAEGTYAWVSGPTYETPAEGRFLRAAGADMVGMSTVPEVLAAREAGVGVLVLSLATNMVVIPEKYRSIKEEVEAELLGKKVELPVEEVVSHEEVLLIGRQKGEMMKRLVEKIIDLIPASVRDESQK